MFQKIYDNKYEKYLLNRASALVELFKFYNRNYSLTKIIINNSTLKKKYFSVFKYINYNYNSKINKYNFFFKSSLKA
jgi:hypothetical protein